MPYTFNEYLETVKSYSDCHKGHLKAIPGKKLSHIECMIDKVLNIETDNQPHFFNDDWRHYRNFYGFLLDSYLDEIQYTPRVAIIERRFLNDIYDCFEKHFSLARSFATPAPIHTMALHEGELGESPCPLKRSTEILNVDPTYLVDRAYFTAFDDEGDKLAKEKSWANSLIFVKDYRTSPNDKNLLQFYTKFYYEDNCLCEGNKCIHEKNQDQDQDPEIVGEIHEFLRFDF